MPTEEQIRHIIARRAALELNDGEVVNLGIGIPSLVNGYVAPGKRIHLHSENGILEIGPPPSPEKADPNLINASRQPVTELPGTSYFDSALSFAMMRGGHIDVTIVGALQVSETGDLASWSVPGRTVLGVGGAMDLVVGAKRVIVAMQHTTKEGAPKLVPKCTLPLTAKGIVNTVVTEHAVFQFRKGRMVLVEIGDHIRIDELQRITSAHFDIEEPLRVANRWGDVQ